MKMIYLTCNITALEDAYKILKENNIKDYQVFTKTLSSSEKTEPRMDTSVWPGHNVSILASILGEEIPDSIREDLKSYNTSCLQATEKIFAVCWNVELLTDEEDENL
jgi:hypothetical protein